MLHSFQAWQWQTRRGSGTLISHASFAHRSQTRAVLDGAGGAAIKVLACTDDVLYGTLDEAIYAQEIDWSQPRPSSWDRPSAWGSQKAVLFSGMGWVKPPVELPSCMHVPRSGAFLAHFLRCSNSVASARSGYYLRNRMHRELLRGTPAKRSFKGLLQGYFDFYCCLGFWL